MCVSPVSIINPTKYVSLRYRDPYLLQVPCGKCVDCQTRNSNEWLYRTFFEFRDCLASGGFVYFDTLTYNNENLPHISDFVNTDIKFSCFNSKHLNLFFKRMRTKLERDFDCDDSAFRYFVSSEYGTSDNYKGRLTTHRPHYHVLFFVSADIDPLVFSSLVSDCWSYGRTDGFPYKSSHYVDSHNTIKVSSLENILRTCNYVTKYVQKSCVFQKQLDNRLNAVMFDIASSMQYAVDDDVDWLNTFEARQFRLKLKREINQFHRQSLHYGESALSEMDLNQIFESGVVYMPHFKMIKLPIVLPTYYKRKLFYKLLIVDGAKTWQPTELGLEFLHARHSHLLDDLVSRFKAVVAEHHLNIDCNRLANYVLNLRGRIKSELPPSTIYERLQSVDLFNYSTVTDKENLGFRGLVSDFLGNSYLGYDVCSREHISFQAFISKYVYLDEDREKELTQIYWFTTDIDKGKQRAHELKQHLTNLYKCFL